MTDERVEQLLERIARERLGLPTLKPRNRDHLDFHTLDVWSLKAALAAAYEAGRADAARGAGGDLLSRPG